MTDYQRETHAPAGPKCRIQAHGLFSEHKVGHTQRPHTTTTTDTLGRNDSLAEQLKLLKLERNTWRLVTLVFNERWTSQRNPQNPVRCAASALVS